MSKHRKHKHRKHRKADPPGHRISVWVPKWAYVGLAIEAKLRNQSMSYLVTESLLMHWGLVRGRR